jgi:hypothetical protein
MVSAETLVSTDTFVQWLRVCASGLITIANAGLIQINATDQETGGLMTNAVATMKAAQVTAAGAGLRIVELEVPDPGPGQVRIKVQACGVCHSDAIIVEGITILNWTRPMIYSRELPRVFL